MPLQALHSKEQHHSGSTMKTLSIALQTRGLLLMAALFTLLLPTTRILAQNVVEEEDPRFYLGLHGLVGIPTGEFGDTVTDAGFGMTGMLGYGIGVAPIMLGLEGGFMIYGSKERTEPWSETIPDVHVKVRTTNSLAFGHLLLRLQPQSGMVRPYLDGLAGFNYLSTSTSVNNEGSSDGESTIASSTNQSDVVFSYGAGGGIMIRLHERDASLPKPATDDEEEERGPAEVLLDLNGRYMWGGAADYLTENSIIRNGSNVQYDVKHSRTDIIALKIGVVVRF
jgi:hypothetical protein